MEFTTEKIPTWALCYLINGDSSGLSEEDKETADRWLAENRVTAVCTASDEEGEYHPYFTHYPAFELASDVVDCNVITI